MCSVESVCGREYSYISIQGDRKRFKLALVSMLGLLYPNYQYTFAYEYHHTVYLNKMWL